MNFLDVKVHLNPQGVLSTGLYTKPTDAHNYLSYTSSHPPKCKDSIPYSQFLRLRRICSLNEDFTNEAREMAGHFHRTGYPKKSLQEAFDKDYRLERQSLLQYTTKTESDIEEKRLNLITTFHPSGSVLDKIMSKNWDILDRSSSTRPLLEYRLIKGYRRPKNVRDLLIRTLTFNPWDVPGPPLIKDPQHDPKLRACTRNNCRYCDRLDTGGRMLCTCHGGKLHKQLLCSWLNDLYSPMDVSKHTQTRATSTQIRDTPLHVFYKKHKALISISTKSQCNTIDK